MERSRSNFYQLEPFLLLKYFISLHEGIQFVFEHFVQLQKG